MKYLKIYFKLFSLNLSNALAYRSNFVLGLFLVSAESVATFLGIAIVFNHIQRIGDWVYPEILVLTGIFMIINAVSWVTFRAGIDILDRIINRGDFDFFLIKPISEQFLVSIYRIDIVDLSRAIVGGFILTRGLWLLDYTPGIGAIGLCIMVFICGEIILYSIQMMLKTISFKSIQGWATNNIFYRLLELTQYPGDIYRGFLKTLYTFVVPIIFVATVPAKVLLGQGTAGMIFGSFAAATVAFLASRLVWRFAVRYYSSASS